MPEHLPPLGFRLVMMLVILPSARHRISFVMMPLYFYLPEYLLLYQPIVSHHIDGYQQLFPLLEGLFS